MHETAGSNRWLLANAVLLEPDRLVQDGREGRPSERGLAVRAIVVLPRWP